ncbi:hypothetical protein [Streptomyces sp. URMC 125]|uniref:hypothetical protein n=1 Tax=Streptomyces sp. URMC 125 TaxID=3423419 RepID=UPI003F19AD70
MAPTSKRRHRRGPHREPSVRRPGGRRAAASARRSLRREAPGTVAVVADPAGFAAMRHRYTTFLFEDHPTYLRQVEKLLRSLTARGVRTSVGLFDPDDYARFCVREHIDPDTSDSRARYAAELAATGATVRYRGRPLVRLLPLLLAGRPRYPGGPTAARPGEGSTRGALEDAGDTVADLLGAAGPGTHHLVCSVTGTAGPLVAVLHAEAEPPAPPRTDPARELVFRAVLAAGLAAGRPGGVVMRTVRGGREEVRGWSLAGGRLRPLTEAEVFSAYCTDVETGEPVPPEPGLAYRAGFPLPRPSGSPGAAEGEERGKRRGGEG